MTERPFSFPVLDDAGTEDGRVTLGDPDADGNRLVLSWHVRKLPGEDLLRVLDQGGTGNWLKNVFRGLGADQPAIARLVTDVLAAGEAIGDLGRTVVFTCEVMLDGDRVVSVPTAVSRQRIDPECPAMRYRDAGTALPDRAVIRLDYGQLWRLVGA